MCRKNHLKLYLIVIMILIFSISVLAENSEESYTDDSTKIYLNSQIFENLEFTNKYQSSIGMDIYWEFNANGDLHMVLKAPVSGWISIGFEPTRRMADAKIIIIGFQNEEVLLEEHIGTSQTRHTRINEKYIVEYKGYRNEEYSLVEFLIPINENSRYNIEKNKKQTVIIGFHNSSDNFVVRHTQRTTIQIEF